MCSSDVGLDARKRGLPRLGLDHSVRGSTVSEEHADRLNSIHKLVQVKQMTDHHRQGEEEDKA